MNVVNPQGWLKNALKRGSVKDLHRFSESIRRTWEESEAYYRFGYDDEDLISKLEFIRRQHELVKDNMQRHAQVAESVHAFVHDPSINKVTVEGKTVVSDDSVDKMGLGDRTTEEGFGERMRLPVGVAALYAESLFIEIALKGTTTEYDRVLAISNLTQLWRVYYIPKRGKDVHPCLYRTEELMDFSYDCPNTSVIPFECPFLEMRCDADGWKIGRGINVSARCDIYVGHGTNLMLLVRPLVNPLYQRNIDVIHAVLKMTVRLFRVVFPEPKSLSAHPRGHLFNIRIKWRPEFFVTELWSSSWVDRSLQAPSCGCEPVLRFFDI